LERRVIINGRFLLYGPIALFIQGFSLPPYLFRAVARARASANSRVMV
jgi:hypothetical protein